MCLALFMSPSVASLGGVLKAVLTVEQGDRQQGAVVLWGAAASTGTKVKSGQVKMSYRDFYGNFVKHFAKC